MRETYERDRVERAIREFLKRAGGSFCFRSLELVEQTEVAIEKSR